MRVMELVANGWFLTLVYPNVPYFLDWDRTQLNAAECRRLPGRREGERASQS